MTSGIITVGIIVGVFFIGMLGGFVISQNTDNLQPMMNNQMMQDTMRNMPPDMMPNSMNTDMPFNPNVPINIPLIDGYYDGKRVYFIHTEVSDQDMAQVMSSMINFPTLYVPELKNIPDEDLSKIYVFTNGVSGMGPYGGGPFMYQIDIFDSIPTDSNYSHFRIPYLVTWNENSNPRVLTSVEELLDSEEKGELTIRPTENIVNAPIIVWAENGKQQITTKIPRIFHSMINVEGQVIMADPDLFMTKINLQSEVQTDMMNSNQSSKSIHMGMSTFMPNQLEIKPNTKVVWTTHDMETHNVNGIFKTDSGKEIPILSGDIEHMQSWSYTFDESGIFEYVCGYHEGMEGVLVVS